MPPSAGSGPSGRGGPRRSAVGSGSAMASLPRVVEAVRASIAARQTVAPAESEEEKEEEGAARAARVAALIARAEATLRRGAKMLKEARKEKNWQQEEEDEATDTSILDTLISGNQEMMDVRRRHLSAVATTASSVATTVEIDPRQDSTAATLAALTARTIKRNASLQAGEVKNSARAAEELSARLAKARLDSFSSVLRAAMVNPDGIEGPVVVKRGYVKPIKGAPVATQEAKEEKREQLPYAVAAREEKEAKTPDQPPAKSPSTPPSHTLDSATIERIIRNIRAARESKVR